jgi:hypothetical protein
LLIVFQSIEKMQKPELVSVSNVSLAFNPEDALSDKRDARADKWRGNSDVYPLAGGKKVGHHHSQFQVLSPGRWLTGGEYLMDFRVINGRGKIVVYHGSWGFRDYFVTTAVHYIWADSEYLYRYVKTNLTVLRDVPDPIGAIWIALANEPDYYAEAVANTCEGLVSYDMRGVTGHALREYALCSYGWIALINPLSSEVRGSPALVLVWSSSTAHPTVYSGANVDNIEIHLLKKDEVRTLRRGEHFELHYLLIVSNQPNNYTWISEAVGRAKPIIELIDKGNIPETASGIARAADYIPLVAGISSVYVVGVPGPLWALSENVVPIVSGDEDTTPIPSVVAAATLFGNGRVVALGHEGFLTNEAVALFDNKKFGINIVKWLDKYGTKKVLVTIGHR